MKKFIITQYSEFIKESLYGNDIYEGRKINIPDDFALWCMDFYAEQYRKFEYSIPKNIITASKKLINSYSDVIYRGFGSDSDVINDMIFMPNDISSNISWTFDEDVARSFAEKCENEGLYPFVAEIEYHKLKQIVSMDVVMDNITHNQMNLIKNDITLRDISDYYSESEILVFDTVKVNAENIKPLWN